MKLMPIPDLNEQEFHVILMGLDELPGKISRELHRKLTEHAIKKIELWRQAESSSHDQPES